MGSSEQLLQLAFPGRLIMHTDMCNVKDVQEQLGLGNEDLTAIKQKYER